ncbi:MAG TPA: hypothetical protein VGO67_07075 [Verrucomicrobiae bacterium]|jgi:hypothetical protein
MTNQTIIEDLRLIPPPPLWENPWVWVIAIVAVGVFYYLWKRRPVSVPAPAVPPFVGPPPHEEALRLLAALKVRHPQMTAYEVSIECSEILRRYIEARFALPLRYQTTREFLSAAHAALAIEWRGELGEFLQFFDGVKFARDNPAGDKTLAAIEGSERFVRRSSGQTTTTAPVA